MDYTVIRYLTIFFMSFAIYSNFCTLMLLQEVFHRTTKESDDGYAGISVLMD